MTRQGRKISSSFAACLSILIGLAIVAPVLMPTDAAAQERVVRRSWSLFDIFAPRSPRNDQGAVSAPRQKARVAKPRKPKSRVAARRAPAEPEIIAVEKLPDARVVLVVGDFLASGLAEGLADSFAQNATIRILDRSKGSSGLVREDVFDWPKEIAAIIDAEKPAAVVAMLGSNDRQQMLVGGKRETFNSEGWVDAYEKRAAALATAIGAKKIPFVWVSMPPFKSSKMSSDMLAFNGIYKAALGSNGEFVDIWDGFADEAGEFVSTGPDVSGQPARLRTGDGINMTKTGKSKVAFYSEKPLRKLLGLESQDGPASPVLPTSPETPLVPKSIDRTEPMALNDPNLDGAVELLGATVPTAANKSSAAGQVAAPVGRADNFLANAPATAVTTTGDEATSTAGR